MKSILQFCLLVAVHQYVLACKVYEYGVNDTDKQTIVDKHNELRKLIANGLVPGQPRGINLKKMVWDDYLAGQAQNIANTCDYRHQRVYDSRWYVGQNMYNQPTGEIEKGTDWNTVVQSWFSEHTQYKYSDYNIFDVNTGHYTQVVWANTSHVGCGYTYYPFGYLYHKLYVCNYGPAANAHGATIYEVGDHGCENLC